jgi:hypothetical protein
VSGVSLECVPDVGRTTGTMQEVLGKKNIPANQGPSRSKPLAGRA